MKSKGKSIEGRTQRYRVAFACACVAAALALAACGGSEDGGEEGFDTGPISLSGEAPEIDAIFVNSVVTIADDRVSLGLLDKEQQPIVDADLRFQLFRIVGTEATQLEEVDAIPIRVVQSFTDLHPDGSQDTHEVGELGVYVARVDFEEPGEYGLKVIGTVKGTEIEPLQARFNVLADAPSVEPGEPAPQTVQPILADVGDIREIDTSDPPDPEMHQMTIADAVMSGRPTVIVFATPSFCTSRICGPTKQTVDKVYEKYREEANFIHVEPYNLEKARSGQALEVLPFLEEEWGLTTEPWVFIVGKDGVVSARFEAAVAQDEIETALRAALTTTKQSIP